MQYLIAIACLALLTLTGCVQQRDGTQRPINSGELGYVLTNTANGLRANQPTRTQTLCTPLGNGAFQCQTQ